MEKVATYSKALEEHAGIAAVGRMLAAMIHYESVMYQESLKHTSVLAGQRRRRGHVLCGGATGQQPSLH